MTRFVRTAAIMLLSAAPLIAGAQDVAKPIVAHDIDVVICLDVSNSMDGLILSAKNKLWDIVNELAKIKPTPNLRVGLYSYGHNSYDAKIGWGHSSVDHAVAFCRAVDARRLVLFHHEPQRSDHALELLEDRARALTGPEQLPPLLAREGMVIELS